MSIADKYQEALNRIPPPGAGAHGALLGAANVGIIAGLSDGQIHGDIRRSIPSGVRQIPDKEIQDAIVKARREVSPHTFGAPYRPIPLPAPRPEIDGEATRQKWIHAGDGATYADIWELSPFKPDYEPCYRDALAVLSLYNADECLFLGTQYGEAVKPVSVWRQEIEGRQEATMPHIIPNPVTGRQHPGKSGKPSYRCDNAICSFRFVIVEFDTLSKPDQFAFWHTVIRRNLLNVALLMDSGGKSLHAWVSINLQNEAVWDKEVRAKLYGKAGVLTTLGADNHCQNPSRLSRLAGHYREAKTNWQTLLYLNPAKTITKG